MNYSLYKCKNYRMPLGFETRTENLQFYMEQRTNSDVPTKLQKSILIEYFNDLFPLFESGHGGYFSQIFVGINP